MSWQSLLLSQKIKPHRTSRQELDDLRDVVRRDLQDAAVEGPSADRQFAIAYNAVLQLGKMVIACAGYRVVGPGHHLTTLRLLNSLWERRFLNWRHISTPVDARETKSTMIGRMRQPRPKPKNYSTRQRSSGIWLRNGFRSTTLAMRSDHHTSCRRD